MITIDLPSVKIPLFLEGFYANLVLHISNLVLAYIYAVFSFLIFRFEFCICSLINSLKIVLCYITFIWSVGFAE